MWLIIGVLVKSCGKGHLQSTLKACLLAPECASKGGSMRGWYHGMRCKCSSIQYPQGFVWEVIFTLYSVHSSSPSISDGKRAAVTATVRLDAMSVNIAQAAEQGQPLLLFTQHLPIISLGKACCLLLLY